MVRLLYFLSMFLFSNQCFCADTLEIQNSIFKYGKLLKEISKRDSTTPTKITDLKTETKKIKNQYDLLRIDFNSEDKDFGDSIIGNIIKLNNLLKTNLQYALATSPPIKNYGISDSLAKALSTTGDILLSQILFSDENDVIPPTVPISAELRTTMPSATIKIKKPKIIKKAGQAVKGAVDGAIAVVKKGVAVLEDLVPDEVKKKATKFLGQGLVVVGKTIKILNDAGQEISVSFEVLAFLESVQNLEDQILSDVNKLLREGVKILPNDIERAFIKFYEANIEVFKATQQAFKTSLEYSFKAQNTLHNAIDDVANFTKTFGEYLILSSNGFPSKLVGNKHDLSQSKLIFNLKEDIINIIANNLLKFEYQTAGREKLLLQFGTPNIRFDEGSQSFIFIIDNATVRGLIDLKIFGLELHPSASLDIKRLEIQLLPIIENNLIKIRPRLYCLDINNVIPKVEEILAWVFETQVADKYTSVIDLNELMSFKIGITNAIPSTVQIPKMIFSFNNAFVANTYNLGLSNHKPSNVPILTSDFIEFDSDILMGINGSFIKDVVDTILNKYNGLTFIPKKIPRFLNSIKGQFVLKELKSVNIEDDKIHFDFIGRIYIRKFLSRERSFEIKSIPFYLIPVIKVENGNYKIILSFKADLKNLEIANAPNHARRLYKNLEAKRFELKPINVDNGAYIQIKHPYVRNQYLLPQPKSFDLKIKNQKLFFIWDY